MSERKTHFYSNQPDYAFWSRAVSQVPPDQLNPVISFPFRIEAREKVATAGSCFAQHIARNLKQRGFNYFVAETAHPIGNMVRDLAERHNYGTFSARYGNIYTTRQLVQLFDRAYGRFVPAEPNWSDESGRWYDPFRPSIEPGGFASEAELVADRDQHFAAVRRMFETLDVFVFTLGLTECWQARADGAAFPVCPGTIAGTYSDTAYEFVNLAVDDVVGDLRGFLDRLRQVNPAARVILTVSPVPLAATAEDRHVLVSTVLSKSVLRVAADVIEREFEHVGYFPSYEIVTSSANAHRNFAKDLRSVTDAAVNHVMSVFFSSVVGTGEALPASAPAAEEDFYDRMEAAAKVVCEEEVLNRD
ncbi:GSCFA domain-containing protein [Marimonas arenosa]|uniref:GSCFA domain-containing protein n=1 Tax=Marimonas arenosa TaxID=1795305 RepID=A0AAE4B385_9RHOB|nr:GSCFA domain-containing protein [Marimonas arenosa]MDQ2089793.1 GSCFA domain-containing protein [Marimonas arenosa]